MHVNITYYTGKFCGEFLNDLVQWLNKFLYNFMDEKPYHGESRLQLWKFHVFFPHGFLWFLYLEPLRIPNGLPMSLHITRDNLLVCNSTMWDIVQIKFEDNMLKEWTNDCSISINTSKLVKYYKSINIYIHTHTSKIVIQDHYANQYVILSVEQKCIFTLFDKQMWYYIHVWLHDRAALD